MDRFQRPRVIAFRCQNRAVYAASARKQRSFEWYMGTFLGASAEMDATDITPSLFDGYRIFHIEGYLVQNYDLIRTAINMAKAAGLTVSLDLASYNVVEDNLDFLREIIPGKVDIVFANEEEAKALTGKEPREALQELGAMDYLILDVMNDMIQQMLSNRLEELKQKENPPFADAGVSNGEYLIAKTKDAMQLEAVGKPGGTSVAIETLIREANRVKEFGFTAGEYDRAKAVYMSNLEKIYNERDKQRNKFYINQYIDHFLVNEPIPSIADRYTTIKQVINYIPLENLNQLAKSMITTNNRVVAIMGTDKEMYPMPGDIRTLIKKVDDEKLTAYIDNTINEPLLQTLPAKGKIVKEEKKQDVVVWTLSNGAKVVVNPTNYKADEILISGYAPGGMSVMDKKHAHTLASALKNRVINGLLK